jgi:hypothetical protein
VARGFRLAEFAVPVRYVPHASSAGVFVSCGYGPAILRLVTCYARHASGLTRSRRLLSLRGQ